MISDELLEQIPKELQERVMEVLQQDPRAAYNKKADYVYGMRFGEYDIRFTVENEVLMVQDVVSVGNHFCKVK